LFLVFSVIFAVYGTVRKIKPTSQLLITL